MNQRIYFLSQVFVVLIVLALVASVLYAIHFVYTKKETDALKLKKLLIYVGLGFFFWLSFLGLMSYAGFFYDTTNLPSRIIWAVVPPVALTIFLLFSKFFNELLKEVPISWMIYIQGFRIPMELILWMGYLGGFVPFQMTFEGFNFDILVGITALLAGFTFFYRGRYLRSEAIIWNISGLTLLLNVILIAVLSAPSSFRVFMNEPANIFIAHFPFIWIPGFILPFAFAVHLFSLKQLFLNRRKKARTFLEGRLTRKK